jgi:hypothetical protein
MQFEVVVLACLGGASAAAALGSAFKQYALGRKPIITVRSVITMITILTAIAGAARYFGK